MKLKYDLKHPCSGCKYLRFDPETEDQYSSYECIKNHITLGVKDNDIHMISLFRLIECLENKDCSRINKIKLLHRLSKI